MRTIALLLLFIPVLATAQTQDVFIELDGVRGDATREGFAGCIEALTFNPGGTNQTEFEFTMNISTASAALKKQWARNNYLVDGRITAFQHETSIPSKLFTVEMRSIKILKCAETMGKNGTMVTSVALSAERVKWVYYKYDAKGTMSGTTTFIYPPIN